MNKIQWNTLLKKATAGDSEAQVDVGMWYEEGYTNKKGNEIIPRNPKSAVYWYRLSANQNNDTAQDALARCLHVGFGIKKDIKESINWSKKAIAQGNAIAAHNLGTTYRDLKKPAMAFKCYTKAVEMGDIDSLYEVAFCHLFGFGTKKNINKAYECFKKIISDGAKSKYIYQRIIEDSYYWMAILHLIGIDNVKKSVSKARKFLEIANKDFDHEQANELLNIIGKEKYIKNN